MALRFRSPARTLLLLLLPALLVTSVLLPRGRGPLRLSAATEADVTPSSVRVTVDATGLARRVVTSQMVFPVKAGPFTLVYPKWIPGAHGPLGPIGNVMGLKLIADGKPVAWRRDTLDLFAFHCDVPAGATTLEATLAYAPPFSTAEALEVSLGVAASAKLAILNWNALVLYPEGAKTDELSYLPAIRLPTGWKFGTALDVGSESDGMVVFRPVSLTRLIDAPVLAGAHFKSFPLKVSDQVVHVLDVAGETPAALEIGPDLLDKVGRLASEAAALFGTRHYGRFHFLLALSDRIPAFGLEHSECTVNSASPLALTGDTGRTWWLSFLLSHEYVHSWNGRARRPAEMTRPDFQQPLRTDLLWVYEGLTQYLGLVLDARSGLWTPEQFHREMAQKAANLDRRPGRSWRPLLDTAVTASLNGRGQAGLNWRGSADYYYEGALIWLEADVLIRQKTGGKRSLDDFCRRFFGGAGGKPDVQPYTADDVFAMLDEIAPHDWKAFFTTRLESTAPHAPLDGLTQAGWTICYGDAKGLAGRSDFDLSYSLGIRLSTDGTLTEVGLDTVAAKAGLAPGMKVIAVDGRRWTATLLPEALDLAKERDRPLELLMEVDDVVKTVRVDYRGGDRQPRLEREAGRPDLLAEILKPLVRTQK